MLIVFLEKECLLMRWFSHWGKNHFFNHNEFLLLAKNFHESHKIFIFLTHHLFHWQVFYVGRIKQIQSGISMQYQIHHRKLLRGKIQYLRCSLENHVRVPSRKTKSWEQSKKKVKMMQYYLFYKFSNHFRVVNFDKAT